MLWWREEFRDISTRFYYLIRIYTIELTKELVKDGVLKKENDIWFLLWRACSDSHHRAEQAYFLHFIHKLSLTCQR